ncbi:MAG: hypothetical protein HY770_07580 [Chitinivibrionia bacterium]|nr:hypothetical protein [Chitinivibrionia bacterium]
MTVAYTLDLVVLVADLDAQSVMQGLLARRVGQLGIRQPRHEVIRHTGRDSGTCQQAHELLRPYSNRAEHALVIFDYEGCGREAARTANAVAAECRGRLASNGWGDRAEVVVLEPELEIWVWSESKRIDDVLGWQGRNPGLREWLREKHFLGKDAAKPHRPKESFRAAIRESGVQYSAALFRELAEKVRFDRCQDSSFLLLRTTLRSWFPA